MGKKISSINLGFVNLLLVLLVIALGFLLTGFFQKQEVLNPTASSSLGGNIPAGLGSCCDSGDGDACKPYDDDQHSFTYNNTKYGLIKSDITLKEPIIHLKDSGQTFQGNPIILNSSDAFNPGYHGAACDGEAIWGPNGECVRIPDDQIVYVCRDKCDAATPVPYVCGLNNATCYGNKDSIYDAYFRLQDMPNIPDVVKNCVKTPISGTPPVLQGQTIVIDKFGEKKNLQLETFKLIAPTPAQTVTTWLSPWCKPAVYLYPEKTSYISVKVNSTQPLTYTDPKYPTNGWGVVADNTGQIFEGFKSYDYLYYETKALDTMIDKPKNGWVVEKNGLNPLFSEILPKLGLNQKEAKQFSDYWVKALPASPYYFIGVMPQDNLDRLATLDINPKPQTQIRVTLYFEPIENKINVLPPVISTPQRHGFTVVEWGGIFKKNKDTKFTCIM